MIALIHGIHGARIAAPGAHVPAVATRAPIVSGGEASRLLQVAQICSARGFTPRSEQSR